MYSADEILNKVNLFISNLPYHRRPESLYEPIKYVLSMGGKRIRPTLMQAVALETYHNYTLLHDDLMDHADLRRGHETVHKRWNDNQAILSGDSMLVLAYERMAQCPADKLGEVLSLFTQTALEIGEGQQYDIDFETRNDVSEDEYIEMIRLKTSVLLACALKIGAVLAGASKADADNLYKFGEQIGLAFQLQDDYLDVYGDPKIFGKAVGGDIVSNKKTYMLINAFNRADSSQRAELQRLINTESFDRDKKVAAVTALYNEMSIDKMAKNKMDFFYEQSQRYLDRVSVQEECKCELRAYAERMMKRKY